MAKQRLPGKDATAQLPESINLGYLFTDAAAYAATFSASGEKTAFTS